MIYLVIGPSCAGKTQFVTNTWIKGSNIELKKDLIKYCETDRSLLIGDWTINAKVRGTDKIARQQYKLIAPQIIRLFESSDKDIVAEGVNLCWSFVAEELLKYKENILLFYIYCDLQTSINRNVNLGNTQSVKNIKSTFTRTNNWFNKYGNNFKHYIVDTNHLFDFSDFSIKDLNLKEGKLDEIFV